jgi:hypothetical protein
MRIEGPFKPEKLTRSAFETLFVRSSAWQLSSYVLSLTCHGVTWRPMESSIGDPVRMFLLGLSDPDLLVRGADPDPSLSHNGVKWTEIMLAK